MFVLGWAWSFSLLNIFTGRARSLPLWNKMSFIKIIFYKINIKYSPNFSFCCSSTTEFQFKVLKKSLVGSLLSCKEILKFVKTHFNSFTFFLSWSNISSLFSLPKLFCSINVLCCKIGIFNLNNLIKFSHFSWWWWRPRRSRFTDRGTLLRCFRRNRRLSIGPKLISDLF